MQHSILVLLFNKTDFYIERLTALTMENSLLSYRELPKDCTSITKYLRPKLRVRGLGPLVSPAVAVCGWCKLMPDLDPHIC